MADKPTMTNNEHRLKKQFFNLAFHATSD